MLFNTRFPSNLTSNFSLPERFKGTAAVIVLGSDALLIMEAVIPGLLSLFPISTEIPSPASFVILCPLRSMVAFGTVTLRAEYLVFAVTSFKRTNVCPSVSALAATVVLPYKVLSIFAAASDSAVNSLTTNTSSCLTHIFPAGKEFEISLPKTQLKIVPTANVPEVLVIYPL